MLFGRNPMSEMFLAMLDLTKDDVGRFRDCYLSDNKIVVFTRNGGGNREDYSEVIESLRAHKHYLTDYDDDFDCTYASFEFNVPDEFNSVISKLQIEDSRPPMDKFKQMLDDLQSGKETAETKHALEVGKQIFSQIENAIKDMANGDIPNI